MTAPTVRPSTLGRGAIALWLVVMWVLLWGDLTLPNVLSGTVIAIALVVAFPPDDTNDDPVVVRPIKALGFLLWFLWALVLTNVAVAKEVLAPASRSDIHPAVVAVPLRTTSGRLATLVANAITLTPGTLTIDARGRPAVLFVHVLSFESVEATRAEVADLERRIVEAFGTDAEVARLGAGAEAEEADAS
ncbi:MAG: Na+/H+ antiporter subunit E [Acidimicrobiales bacterium]|nr:Na+/H+ antiporter subunit E [Acidimicrobiales bacterium]HRW36375.1 Na+/H+ antiporter subunit E [Aquihabitans sp.]